MADSELRALSLKHAGTLNWYSVPFWTKELGLPILELKHEIGDLVKLRPYVDVFVEAMHNAGKRVVMVTNAHGDSLRFKQQRVDLLSRFERSISAHDYGYPKEDLRFWAALSEDIRFDPGRSLFIDDTLSVLRTARGFGVKHVLTIDQPDSQKGIQDIQEFIAVSDYRLLLEGLSRAR